MPEGNRQKAYHQGRYEGDFTKLKKTSGGVFIGLVWFVVDGQSFKSDAIQTTALRRLENVACFFAFVDQQDCVVENI